MNINPVTIPQEWNIKYIRNLLCIFYDHRAHEHTNERNKRLYSEDLDDHFKSQRKEPIPTPRAESKVLKIASEVEKMLLK